MKKILVLSAGFLSILILSTVIIVFSSPDGDWNTNVQLTLQAPSWAHWFGTDSLGRDLLFRTIAGARVTLFMGLACSVMAFVIGVTYGSISAYFGGWIDQVMMRGLEIMISIPQMITIGLIIILFTAKGSGAAGGFGLLKLAFAISLGSWMTFARLSRNLALREKTFLYVDAAITIGANPVRIFYRHILPNLMPSLLVMVGLQLPNFLLFESFLSFLGLGVPPPVASWGVLLQEGWRTMAVYPHLLLLPSLVLFLTVFSLNIVFDQLRGRLMRKFEVIDIHH